MSIEHDNETLMSSIETFLRLLSEECGTCYVKRCESCYTPRAKILYKALSEKRGKRSEIPAGTKLETMSAVVEFLRKRKAKGREWTRISNIPMKGLSSDQKVALMNALCARGFLVGRSEVEPNGHVINLYSVKP